MTLGALLHIDADRLAETLDPAWLVERLRAGHVEGVDQVERLLLTQGADHLLVWAAWQRGTALASKLVTVFPGAEPSIRSAVLLWDGADGRPLALITGEAFTRIKTAADSALGAAFLARGEARTLAILGAGSQALTQARYLLAVRPSLRRIRIWNRTPEKAEAVASALRELGHDAGAARDAAHAVQDADIVSCVTAAAAPVLRGAWLKSGAHVDLVGGFTADMRESDDDTVRRATLFCDTRRFTVEVCGDFVDPIRRDIITPDAVVADLFDLCAGRAPGRRTAAEITLFKNGGGGHLDLMAARALLQHRTVAGLEF